MNTPKEKNNVFYYTVGENGYDLYMYGVLTAFVPFVYRASDFCYIDVTEKLMNDIVKKLNQGLISVCINIDEEYMSFNFDVPDDNIIDFDIDLLGE